MYLRVVLSEPGKPIRDVMKLGIRYMIAVAEIRRKRIRMLMITGSVVWRNRYVTRYVVRAGSGVRMKVHPSAVLKEKKRMISRAVVRSAVLRAMKCTKMRRG